MKMIIRGTYKELNQFIGFISRSKSYYLVKVGAPYREGAFDSDIFYRIIEFNRVSCDDKSSK
ncbi:MAG: hypothetical protein NC244_12995 [Alistipes senegalensis]|nr:hypothetical protein [Alistipes senegalensis]